MRSSGAVLVTDGFVFLHVPKTGGTFIHNVLSSHLSGIDHRAIGKRSHVTYRELRPEWRQRPVFCVVRNPWDWYVSWFSYQAYRRQRPTDDEPKWFRGLRRGRVPFKEAVTRLCIGDFNHRLVPLMHEEGIDFCSAHVRSIGGEGLDQPNFTVLRYELLRDGLLGFLREHIAVPPGLAAAIRHSPPVRVSKRGPYPDYYDAELAELVGEKASWLCERFGYSFEGSQPISHP
jgi:hypothetical protein